MPRQYYYKGIETTYLVYPDGRIYSKNSNKFIHPYLSKNGYKYVQIYISGKKYHRAIHQMVAEAFIPNPDNKSCVNHKDGNKLNNWDWNLEWSTYGENSQHSYDIGLKKAPSGSSVHFSKYSEDMVELACQKMSEDILTLSEIENLTKIPHKTLCDIRAGNIWKDISIKYIFPKQRTIASRIGLKPNEKKEN